MFNEDTLFENIESFGGQRLGRGSARFLWNGWRSKRFGLKPYDVTRRSESWGRSGGWGVFENAGSLSTLLLDFTA